MNRIKIILYQVGIIYFIINCSSVDIEKLKKSNIDNERVGDIEDFSKIQLKKFGVLINSKTKMNLAGEYGQSFKEATKQLINTLGGVEAVAKRKSWEKQLKEQRDALKQELEKLREAQLKGEDSEFEMQPVKTRFNAWYEIHANLNGLTSHTVYHPPKWVTIKDKDGKEIQVQTEPYWRTDVNVYVFFKVLATNPGQAKKVVLIRNLNNSFGKSFSVNPSKDDILKLYPEAILYCYEDIKEELQELFPIKTYLTEMRDEKGYGKIIGGKDLGITEGRKFRIYQKAIMPTIIGNKVILHEVGKIKIIKVAESESWGKLTGPLIFGLGSKEEIKIGMDAVLIPERRTILHKIWRKVKQYIGIKGLKF